MIMVVMTIMATISNATPITIISITRIMQRVIHALIETPPPVGSP